MPIITLQIGIEKDIDEESFKHLLNHENFDVFSTREDKNLFAMYAKKPKIKITNNNLKEDSNES